MRYYGSLVDQLYDEWLHYEERSLAE
jgi:hypothetical protein